MRCSACSHDNPSDANFCGWCGRSLQRSCAACGRENPAGVVFCGACGSPLHEAPAPARAAERRLLTVMFCDLVGSTELSQRLDPEDFRELLRTLQETCALRIERFGGHVAQYLGDGLLVYFGYPRAHEDDAVRAVHAALAIREALPALCTDLARSIPALGPGAIRLRTGIHTGSVVVGDVGGGARHERLALGDTVNLASRLLGVAEPDWIVLSQDTLRLLGTSFRLADLGPQALRGLDEPVGVLRVIAAAAEPGSTPSPTPLVGRRPALDALARSCRRAEEAHGQLVLLSGEAGIGKSRLVEAFCASLPAAQRIEGRCSPYHQATAFFPLVGALRRYLGVSPDDDPEASAKRLEEALLPSGLEPAKLLPLLAALLGVALPERYARPAESADARRRHTLDALSAWLAAEAGRHPLVVLVVEDLHWADPSTLELLGRFAAGRADRRLLLLFTSRGSFPPAWSGDPEAVRIALGPLARAETETLVRTVAGARTLSDALVTRIVDRSDGIPLFAEQMTRALLETGVDHTSGEAEIPSTLQGSLMARIDNLGPARELAQFASVLGRQFPRALLEAAGRFDATAIEHGLEELVRMGLLHRESPAGDEYAFRHALIQETAYRSQLRRQRRDAHWRVAATLEGSFPERVDEEPETLAHHCEEAGRTVDAIAYLKRAACDALDRSAPAEAMVHLERGLALQEKLPEGPDRARWELELRILMGTPLAALKGYGHPDVERSHTRARELSREVGEGPWLYAAVGVLYLFHASRAEMKPAADLAAQLLALGERARDPFVRQFGEAFSGVTRFYEGRFPEARVHFERMLALEPESPGRPEWYRHEEDPGVVARAYRAMTLAMLGELDEARASAEAAVERARHVEQPFNVGFAMGYATLVFHLLGDPARVLELADEGARLCEEQGFPVYLGMCTMLRGWAWAEQGEPERGVAELRRGMAIGASTQTLVEGPRAFALLAEARRRAGDLDAAAEALASGLGLARSRGNVFWDAELLRLSAELAAERTPPDPDAARDAYRGSLALARRQGAARLLERTRRSMAAHRIEVETSEP